MHVFIVWFFSEKSLQVFVVSFLLLPFSFSFVLQVLSFHLRLLHIFLLYAQARIKANTKGNTLQTRDFYNNARHICLLCKFLWGKVHQ